jgi:hypothetical protein
MRRARLHRTSNATPHCTSDATCLSSARAADYRGSWRRKTARARQARSPDLCALPVCVNEVAKQVILTDYPDVPLLDNLKKNVAENLREDERARAAVQVCRAGS